MKRQNPVALLSIVFASFYFCTSSFAAGFKVAFTGDQGTDANAQAVLSLVASEAADLLMIQGDLGYGKNSADAWNDNLDNALGADFPVLSLVGNHDDTEWPRYQELINQRLDRMDGVQCTGRAGVKATCKFANIEIIQVAPGINEIDSIDPDDDYAGYIRSAYSEPSNRWRICSWHKNQRNMQTGEKGNGTGWDVFEACLDAGAFVAMGHEHAYSRTHLLSNFETQAIVNKDSVMQLQPGQSFAFVSGLGGWQVRPQVRGGDWWASIYTATQGATHGALFCTFEAVEAECYFKAIDGSVPDQFSLRLGVTEEQTPTVVVAENTPPQTPIPVPPAPQQPAAEEEPEPVVEEEPEPTAEEEPEPAVEEEPEAEEAPEPVVEEEPEPVTEEEPEPVAAEEPEPVTAETAEPAVETVPEPIAEIAVAEAAATVEDAAEVSNTLDQSGNPIKTVNSVFSATTSFNTLILLIIAGFLRRRAGMLCTHKQFLQTKD